MSDIINETLDVFNDWKNEIKRNNLDKMDNVFAKLTENRQQEIPNNFETNFIHATQAKKRADSRHDFLNMEILLNHISQMIMEASEAGNYSVNINTEIVPTNIRMEIENLLVQKGYQVSSEKWRSALTVSWK